ncbi:MAG: hypothetical protein MPN21_15590 [Thermoanaerobaculia bacterium]|nr:hypothetical protein [Thermoanaerobaculia bacterium]
MSFQVELSFSGLGVAHMNKSSETVDSVDLTVLNQHGHQAYLYIDHEIVKSNTIRFGEDGYQLLASPVGRVVVKIKIRGRWYIDHDGSSTFDERREPTIGTQWLGLDSLIQVEEDLGINDYRKLDPKAPCGWLSIPGGGELNARSPLLESAAVARKFSFRRDCTKSRYLSEFFVWRDRIRSLKLMSVDEPERFIELDSQMADHRGLVQFALAANPSAPIGGRYDPPTHIDHYREFRADPQNPVNSIYYREGEECVAPTPTSSGGCPPGSYP